MNLCATASMEPARISGQLMLTNSPMQRYDTSARDNKSPNQTRGGKLSRRSDWRAATKREWQQTG